VLPKTIAGLPLLAKVIVCATVPLDVYSTSDPAFPPDATPAHLRTTTLPGVKVAAGAINRPRLRSEHGSRRNFFIVGGTWLNV
jgi:hypothetical protein